MMVTVRCCRAALAATGRRTVLAPGSSRKLLNAKNSAAGRYVRIRPCGPRIDVTSGNRTTGTGVVLRAGGSGRVTESAAQLAAPATWQMASQERGSSGRWGGGGGGAPPGAGA